MLSGHSDALWVRLPHLLQACLYVQVGAPLHEPWFQRRQIGLELKSTNVVGRGYGEVREEGDQDFNPIDGKKTAVGRVTGRTATKGGLLRGNAHTEWTRVTRPGRKLRTWRGAVDPNRPMDERRRTYET